MHTFARKLRLFLLILLVMLTGIFVYAQTDTADDTWTRYSGNGITLSVPSGWFDLSDSQQFRDGLNILSATNPTFASYLQSLSGLDVFLLDPVQEASININVVAVTTIPPLNELLPLMQPEYDALGFTVNAMQVLGLPVGNAGRFRLTPTTNDANGNALTTTQFQYVIPSDDALIFVTFSAPPERFDDLLPTFETIADTLEISGNSGGWQRYSGAILSLRVPSDWRSRVPGQNTQIAVGLPDDTVTLDVTATTLETPPALADILLQLEESYSEQGREVIVLERVSLPAGVFVRGETTLVDGDLTRVQVQYIGVIDPANGENHYITATFTVEQSLAERYLPLFARMMHTLRGL
ncbi:MAG: hypothetical protein RLP44_32600 [Aggregatilineales bacterium]